MYRTVCITGILEDVTTFDVVKQLIFGPVTKISPSILTTVNGFRSLCVTFLDEQAANRCIAHMKEQLRTLDMVHHSDLSLRFVPQLVPSPQLHPDMHRLIDTGTISRVLRISRLRSSTTSAQVMTAFSVPGTTWTNILAIEDTQAEEGKHDLVIHFNAVTSAIRAYRLARFLTVFEDCDVEFVDDPSDQRAEECRGDKEPVPAWIRRDREAYAQDGRRGGGGRGRAIPRQYENADGEQGVSQWRAWTAPPTDVDLSKVCWDPTLTVDEDSSDGHTDRGSEAEAGAANDEVFVMAPETMVEDVGILIPGLDPVASRSCGDDGTKEGAAMQKGGRLEILNLMD